MVQIADIGRCRVVATYQPETLERKESVEKVRKELKEQGFVKLAEYGDKKWKADARQQLAQERVRILDGLDALQNGKFKHGETNHMAVLGAVRQLVLACSD